MIVETAGPGVPEGWLLAVVLMCVALLAALLLLRRTWRGRRIAERRLQDLVRLLPDMFLECDANWRIAHMNSFARLQLGY